MQGGGETAQTFQVALHMEFELPMEEQRCRNSSNVQLDD